LLMAAPEPGQRAVVWMHGMHAGQHVSAELFRQ
jgi:hypothetical protein